jgi:IS4 transposase
MVFVTGKGDCFPVTGDAPLFRINHQVAHTYEFITNDLEMRAQEIADIYKRRWQVELFFKWIKQNLKIKSFWGTSENAVFSQI